MADDSPADASSPPRASRLAAPTVRMLRGGGAALPGPAARRAARASPAVAR